MNAQTEDTVHVVAPTAAEASAQTPLRARWPDGLFGTLAFLWDHKLYGFTAPVDWPGAYAAENSMYPWPPADGASGKPASLRPNERDTNG